MSELSDLALLEFGAAALFILYLLRVIFGRYLAAKKRRTKPTIGETHVIVDGSNVMHWGGEPSEFVLKRVIDSLISKGFELHVIFDANVGYKLGGSYLDDAPMAKLIGLPASRVLVVEKGVAADEKILQVATEQNVGIVSNDRFRDWTTRYPIVRKKGRIMRGTWKDGAVVWQSI